MRRLVGLTVPERQGRKSTAEYGIVAGKLYPTDTPEVSEAAVAEIRRVPRRIRWCCTVRCRRYRRWWEPLSMG